MHEHALLPAVRLPGVTDDARELLAAARAGDSIDRRNRAGMWFALLRTGRVGYLGAEHPPATGAAARKKARKAAKLARRANR